MLLFEINESQRLLQSNFVLSGTFCNIPSCAYFREIKVYLVHFLLQPIGCLICSAGKLVVLIKDAINRRH